MRPHGVQERRREVPDPAAGIRCIQNFDGETDVTVEKGDAKDAVLITLAIEAWAAPTRSTSRWMWRKEGF